MASHIHHRLMNTELYQPELPLTWSRDSRPATRRERTPEEEQEWLEDKRAEHEADRICGHHWSNI